MKQKTIFFLLLLMSTINLYSQNNIQESGIYLTKDDPFLKPKAPGYDEVRKAGEYFDKGDKLNNLIYLEKAAHKNNLLACYIYAGYCLSGAEDILKCDTVKAIQYMKYAADNGYAPAQECLAHWYMDGINSGLSIADVENLLINSAKQGYKPAKISLANFYVFVKNGNHQDINKGLIMLEENANGGHAYSQYMLGEYYTGKYGDTPDYSKAVKWYSIASSNGLWQASNNLALLYAEGKGAEKNYNKAHSLIITAREGARLSGNLTKEVEANLYDTDGEIYMKEGKMDKANAIWQMMKNKYPEYIEKNIYEPNNVFVRTMYIQEKDANKPSLATNTNNDPVTPSIVSDIDEIIPENTVVGNPVFAVIIANENYKEVEAVPFAVHDGETFKLYCEKTLGIPPSNIKFIADATLNNIKRELNWIGQVMDVYQGEASVIFYYAGHGIPDESNGAAYLLPVDGIGNDYSSGYGLDKLYADLNGKPAKSVVVFLDACFSGAKRDGGMLTSARGVAIKAKQNAPQGNMVVLSAAQGDETAYPYKEKGHGLFTYYLLKKLQETKGDVTFGELSDYITTEVKKRSIIINGKLQTPLASPSSNAKDWRNWKLR